MSGVKISDNRTNWDTMVAELKELQNKAIVVGVFGSSGSDLVEYATTNEFGAMERKIPERSFLRGMLKAERNKIIALSGKLKSRAITRKNGAMWFARLIGMYAQDAVKRRITNSKQWAVPNSPATIKAKSKRTVKDTPLIDTGRLRASIVYQIVPRAVAKRGTI